MDPSSSPIESIGRYAEQAGIAAETSEFASEIARVVVQSGYATDRPSNAVAAGCLYAAALATGSGTNGGLRFERSFTQSNSEGSTHRSRPRSESGPSHYRVDRKTTQITICKTANITPVSLRRYTKETAEVYLDAEDATSDPRTRERLARIALR